MLRQLTNLPCSKEELIAEIGDVDVLIMRVDPKIDKEIIDAAKNLKVIGVCSVGLNHIDMDYAKSKGIQVFNAPGLNANAVAELTILQDVRYLPWNIRSKLRCKSKTTSGININSKAAS